MACQHPAHGPRERGNHKYLDAAFDAAVAAFQAAINDSPLKDTPVVALFGATARDACPGHLVSCLTGSGKPEEIPGEVLLRLATSIVESAGKIAGTEVQIVNTNDLGGHGPFPHGGRLN